MVKSKKKRFANPVLFFGTLAVICIVIIVAVLELTNTTHIFHAAPKVVSAGQYTKGEPTDTSSTTSKGSSSKGSPAPGTTTTEQPGDEKSNSNDTNGDTDATLLTPTGNAISNHTPGKDGAPLTETSVCNTTPGVTCQITFTMNGNTKSLPAQTTDRGGATYWNNWSPSSVGLTTGTWQVTTTATAGGQTKSASDAIGLQVQ